MPMEFVRISLPSLKRESSEPFPSTRLKKKKKKKLEKYFKKLRVAGNPIGGGPTTPLSHPIPNGLQRICV
jgi:hypothetical protein